MDSKHHININAVNLKGFITLPEQRAREPGPSARTGASIFQDSIPIRSDINVNGKVREVLSDPLQNHHLAEPSSVVGKLLSPIALGSVLSIPAIVGNAI